MLKAEPLPPDASIASAGLGIRYIGDYCYAYSGAYSITTGSQTMLSFLSGAGVIDGKLLVSGPFKFSDPSAGGKSNFQLSFNEEVVFLLGSRASNTDYTNPLVSSIKIIIPPYTNVVLTVDSSATDATIKNCAILTGRVYGMTE